MDKQNTEKIILNDSLIFINPLFLFDKKENTKGLTGVGIIFIFSSIHCGFDIGEKRDR